jgi:hypothetical protein
MASPHLDKAKSEKNDEYYTQYEDIEKEVNAYLDFNPDVFKGKVIFLPCDDPEWSSFTKYFAQNFERFKLKKLISTSYAVESKAYKDGYQTTLFEEKNPKFDKNKTRIKGKIFTLTKDKTGDNRINIDDLDWQYMEGDGDFRSKEVKRLRNEADIIITNPPFSLFREFLVWIVEAKKQLLIIGNKNCISYKEVFSSIMKNEIWLGCTSPNEFLLPGGRITKKVNGLTRWITNIEHGRRHQHLPLMTIKDNLKYNKKMKDKKSYDNYDNYDAIEVPSTNSIPSDYKEVMGVPITFLDKYNPEQFEIMGCDGYVKTPSTKKYPKKSKVVDKKRMKSNTGTMGCVIKEEEFGSGTYFDVGYPVRAVYKRIFIKHKKRIKGN